MKELIPIFFLYFKIVILLIESKRKVEFACNLSFNIPSNVSYTRKSKNKVIPSSKNFYTGKKEIG